MLPTQREIDAIAFRIESSYLRRRPATHHRQAEAVAGVWESAAAGLLILHQVEPEVPADPELFVAVLTLDGRSEFNPWQEVAGHQALDRYRLAIWGMISGLRQELRAEIKRAERRIRRGERLDEVLVDSRKPISPLAGYIVAHRAGREDLKSEFRDAAESQHIACPLYEPAAARLVPPEDYPHPTVGMRRADSHSALSFSAN